LNPLEAVFNLGLKSLSFLTFLGHGKGKTTIYSVDHDTKFELRVNTMDKFVVWEIWKVREYKDPEFEIKPDDVVVDIGAHIGAFSVYAAKNAPKGEVYSYEPQKDNYKQLLKNKALNNLSNIHTFNLAVADKKGSLDLFIGSDNGVNSIYQTDSTRKVEVQATTVNDILAHNRLCEIDYLKIDAEGAEYNIILKMPAETLRKISRITMEFHDRLCPDHRHSELKNYLEKNGFKVTIYSFPLVTRLFGTGVLMAKRLNA
jgi:FkbM family methyltransferase